MTPLVIICGAGGPLAEEVGAALQQRGIGVSVEGRASSDTHPAAVIVLALDASDRRALAAVRAQRVRDPELPVVLVAGESSEELAIGALRAGASDYFRPPVDPAQVAESIERLARRRAQAPNHPPGTSALVSSTPQMDDVKRAIREAGPTESSVLVTGETGTGKELVAGMLHRASQRRDGPFVCIDCAAVPESLLESELFGHERGAFTGAVSRREGRLRQGDGGTVFLDEIGDMGPGSQAKILRALESRQVLRVGANRPLPLDVRFVAATNHDLERSVVENRFRGDLYYRLNVVNIHLPPLRERKEDIPILCDHFMRYFNWRFRRSHEELDAADLELLMGHGWPGNVRELRNLIEASFVTTRFDAARLSLPSMVRERLEESRGLDQTERDRLVSALLATGWNVSHTARNLSWSRMTLYRKMAKYKITRTARG